MSRPIGSHFIELDDVMPQNSFAISLRGVLQKEMQVGDLHVCLLQIFFWFLLSPVLHTNELFINPLLQCQV